MSDNAFSRSDADSRPGNVAAPAAWVRPGRLWRTPQGPGWGPLPELLLTLTAVTGLVDAVSILALGRVFVANMTGNVVFAGFALAGAPGFSLGASLFALAGFLAGAAVGGRLTTRVGHDRALHLRAAVAAEVVLLAAALVIAAAAGGAGATHGTLHIASSDSAFGPAAADALSAVLAIAMGIQNAAARALAVPDLTTTVLTMTLTGIGSDARSGRRGHVTLVRRVLVVATMLAGGVAGAELVLNVGAVVPLALATGLLALAAGVAARAARRPGEWRQVTPAASPAAPAPRQPTGSTRAD
jgi:uncharacterized membrane protein YoaK (UPF0700 family)